MSSESLVSWLNLRLLRTLSLHDIPSSLTLASYFRPRYDQYGVCIEVKYVVHLI